jgi:hypothetical protein
MSKQLTSITEAQLRVAEGNRNQIEGMQTLVARFGPSFT